VDPVVRTVYRVRTVVLTFSGSMTTRSPIFPLGCTRSTSSSSLQSRPLEGRVDRVLTAEVMGGSGVCCRLFGKVVPTSARSFEHMTCASALPIKCGDVLCVSLVDWTSRSSPLQQIPLTSGLVPAIVQLPLLQGPRRAFVRAVNVLNVNSTEWLLDVMVLRWILCVLVKLGSSPGPPAATVDGRLAAKL